MKINHWIRAAFLGVASLVASSQAFSQFKVVGYMPSWSGDVNAVQYSKLTHINYAFLLPTATGGLQSIDNASKLSSLVFLAHANGVKVLISVGGWNNGDDSGFESLAANSTYRTTYAALIARGADPYSDTYSGVGYNGITTIICTVRRLEPHPDQDHKGIFSKAGIYCDHWQCDT